MLKAYAMYLVCVTAGWWPVIDQCSDVCGANSQAPFYYDAQSDGSLQEEFLEGMDIVSNPPFKDPEPFIDCINRAYAKNPKTRAYLVVPERPNQEWFKELEWS